MLSTFLKQVTPKNFMVFLAVMLFFSCQKEISGDDSAGIGATPPDLTTKISSSVSGFVTDENDAAVMGATVQIGGSTIITDKYGYFEARNVQVVKEAAVVTVNKTGYFKGIKTYIAREGKAAFFRIKLMPKTVIGTIDAGTGGTITQPNGFSIKLLAGSIVNASTNASYSGPVTVLARWIDPTAADLPNIMPGDLRGTNTDGYMRLLQTYGMAAVELTGSSGELLQIVNGQKATVTIPLPSSLTATAPATIPLWYFDENKGLWKQEGSATKTGNTYVGDVGHFSFWNCDVPANYVQFDCTLKNSSGNPLPYTLVKITVAGTNNSGYGFTDSSGYVGGAIPANANLLLEVFTNFGCTTSIYQQTFSTTNVNVSLGNITVPTANHVATVNGTVTTCANTAVTNGYIIVKEGNIFTRYPLNNTGAYSFSKVFCSIPQTIILVGEDITNTQQSSPVTYVVNAGTNTVANIQACGTSIGEFVNYTINTTNFSHTFPVDSIIYTGTNSLEIEIFAYRPGVGNGPTVNISFDAPGIGLNSLQPLASFIGGNMQQTAIPVNPILVNITEYGAIGQFVSGTFTGTVREPNPPNTTYNVTCNFRVRRTF